METVCLSDQFSDVRSESLNTLWIHFRRLAMSLMLVAAASFVLHSGALAGLHQHGKTSPDCHETASAGHRHHRDHGAGVHVHQASHAHGNPVLHHHVGNGMTSEVAPDIDQSSADAQAPCCASACPIAMAPLSLDAISAPMILALSLVPGSQRGSGIDPGHLKRPPRAIGIA
jgi:hypothetical protein